MNLADRPNPKDPNKKCCWVAYNNNKFKISVPAWNDRFDLTQCQTFKIILSTLLKKQTIADKPPVQIYTNKIKNRIVLKIKTGYKIIQNYRIVIELYKIQNYYFLKQLKYQEVQKKMLIKIKIKRMCRNQRPVEVVFVHCNLVTNNFQKESKVLFTFVPNKQFGQLITTAPHSLTMLKTTST